MRTPARDRAWCLRAETWDRRDSRDQRATPRRNVRGYANRFLPPSRPRRTPRCARLGAESRCPRLPHKPPRKPRCRACWRSCRDRLKRRSSRSGILLLVCPPARPKSADQAPRGCHPAALAPRYARPAARWPQPATQRHGHRPACQLDPTARPGPEHRKPSGNHRGAGRDGGATSWSCPRRSSHRSPQNLPPCPRQRNAPSGSWCAAPAARAAVLGPANPAPRSRRSSPGSP